ncbi:MAG TPA: hypothetical protein VNR17_13045 [Luteimicrobium sp.]|nr:hypothetical protein [Luteimicrobium sp.]
MSTDDEFARSLRERADAAVPAMSVDPVTTLHLGRRRVRARHAWQVGSVVAAVGVVAVVIGPTLPHLASDETEAGVPTTTATISAPPTAGTPATDPAPGFVAAQGTVTADERGQVDLGTWHGIAVWLADDELHVQADSTDAVSASRTSASARVELYAPGAPAQGVFAWGDVPAGDTGATPYLWTTARPVNDPGTGPLVVRLPTFSIAGGSTGRQWAVGMFGSSVDVSDTSQIGVVYADDAGRLSSPSCPDLAARTCLAPLPPAVATAVQAATGRAAAPSTGAGNGHSTPSGLDRSTQREAAALMGSMADAIGDGSASAQDPGAAAEWRTLDHRLDVLVEAAERRGFSRGDGDARVVELGFFTYPGFLHDRSAEWVGWIDGERVTVSLDARTGRLRYVGPGSGGARLDDLLPSGGARMVDVVSHASDQYLVGSVLGFVDAQGGEHHLDLLARSWLD